MFRKILAIIAGFISASVVMLICEFLNSLFFPFPAGMDMNNLEAVRSFGRTLPWNAYLLVANVYYQHNWPREEFNNQILALVEWEKKQFGDYKHTTVAQTAQMLNDYLKLKTVIHENPSFDDVKKILASGHLIVMTFAGKELGNPNYRNGGPVYHAMVIKGYKADQKIITNDVGTRNGADYVYDWKTIQSALHDYNEPIDSGAKKFIEVLPAASGSSSS